MSVYTATSWGRTRRPKQLTDDNIVPDFQGKTTGTSVAFVTNVSHFAADLDSATEGRNGYATENQRFLHLFVKDNSATGKSINVYGYNYAFGEWAPLLISLGNATMTAVNCSSGAVVGQGQHHIIDVSGIDRVGFFQTGTDAPDRIRAAFSTFQGI